MKTFFLDLFFLLLLLLSAFLMNLNLFGFLGAKPNLILIFLISFLSLKRSFLEFFFLSFFSLLALAWLPSFSRELFSFSLFLFLVYCSGYFISFGSSFGFLFFLAISTFIFYSFINPSFLLSAPLIVALEAVLNFIIGWFFFFFLKKFFSENYV
ncbi:MAG: hypothetical protein WC435_02910 [Candidatus Paceibacterota bacterium]